MSIPSEWLEKDYYAVLGVADTASEAEITKAYRALARKLHPDLHPDDPSAAERFKDVSAAHEVLGDPERRRQYDEVRRLGPMAGGFAGRGAATGGPGGYTFDLGDLGDLGDLFGGVFGQGRAGGARRGRDQEAQLRLSFEEAVRGVTTQVSVGAGGGQPPRSLAVRIPAGVDDGQRIRLRGKGAPGVGGGPPGDLFVIVRVGEHPLFGRDGRHLTLTLPITFPEAALGARVKVPTFDGDPVTLRVPAGTQSGQVFRVKGRGVSTGKGAGDLLVKVEIAVPQHLSADQKAALEEFARAGGDETPRAHLGV